MNTAQRISRDGSTPWSADAPEKQDVEWMAKSMHDWMFDHLSKSNISFWGIFTIFLAAAVGAFRALWSVPHNIETTDFKSPASPVETRCNRTNLHDRRFNQPILTVYQRIRQPRGS